MQPARMMLCVAAVVVVTMMPQTQATFSLGALPAAASVGGLAALKVLKYFGLSKLTSTISDSGLDVLTDLTDSGAGDEYYARQPPAYVAPPPTYVAQPPSYAAPPPSYYPPPLPLSGPPAFYIVPASHFDEFRRNRRDVSKVTGSEPAGIVAVSSEKEYFEVIGGLDQGGCVLRAVCEVAGAPLHSLTEDEKAIMAAFSDPYEPSRSPPTTTRGKYYQAMWVGRTAGDATTICAKMYSRCTVPARQLLKALEEEEHHQQQEGKVSRQ